MMVAAAEPCDDFPEPQNPADLSGYASSQTVDPAYESTDDTAVPTTPTDEGADEEDADEPPAGGYDPDLYAPGAGQEPAPTPDPPDSPAPGDVAPGGPAGGTPPTGGAGGVDPN
jgi:hypothetical protein